MSTVEFGGVFPFTPDEQVLYDAVAHRTSPEQRVQGQAHLLALEFGCFLERVVFHRVLDDIGYGDRARKLLNLGQQVCFRELVQRRRLAFGQGHVCQAGCYTA